jgi:hypothetical protein
MNHTVRTIAELLQEVLEHETKALDQETVPHGPTIGSMYETLTAEELARHLPADAGLSVVSGFAQGHEEVWSKEVDCMVVIGEGRSIPRSQKKVYPVHQIVAVIEVKKNLNCDEINDGHEKSKSVVTLTPEDGMPYGTAQLNHVFYRTTGRALHADFRTLPADLLMIYSQLMFEAKQPVRILMGYHGLKSETALRNALLRHINSLDGRQGYAPATFPTLVVAPCAVAIKAVGSPWIGRYRRGNWRLLFTSDKLSPIRAMLNAIWWRLCVLGFVDRRVFSEESTSDTLNKLVSFRPDPKLNAWHFETH